MKEHLDITDPEFTWHAEPDLVLAPHRTPFHLSPNLVKRPTVLPFVNPIVVPYIGFYYIVFLLLKREWADFVA